MYTKMFTIKEQSQHLTNVIVTLRMAFAALCRASATISSMIHCLVLNGSSVTRTIEWALSVH